MHNSIFCPSYLPLLGKTISMKIDIDANVCAKLKVGGGWEGACLSRVSKIYVKGVLITFREISFEILYK